MTAASMEIGTDVLLTIATGRMLCPSFADVQAAADFLIGEPTMTHNFASHTLVDRLEAEVKRQHPWTADDEKVLPDYPDLDGIEDGEARGAAIMCWLDEHVYPVHGRTVTIEPEPEHVHLPFWSGLEHLGATR